MGSFGLPVFTYMIFFLFLFSSNIATCLLVIYKTYQLGNLEANHLSIQLLCRNYFLQSGTP